MGDVFALVVELEENLEGSAVARSLELTPESTLVASNAVHQAADVSEAVAEILLQRRALAINKHEVLVKDLGHAGRPLRDLEDLCAGCGVLGGVAGAEGVVGALEIGAELGDGAGHEGVIEVDVADAVGELVQTVVEAVEVGLPLARGLVQEVPAEMGADACVHAGHDAVEDALLEAFVVDLEASVGDEGGVGLLESLLLQLLLATGRIENLFESHGRGTRGLPLRDAQVGMMGERALLEAILPIDGFPDLSRAITSITRVPLRISGQAHIVALGASALIISHAIIPFVALIVVLNHTALANLLSQLALQRSFGVLSLGLLPGVLGARALELAEFLGAPGLGDVLLVVQSLYGASDVAAHAILVVPKGAALVEEVQSVVGEEIGRSGEVVDGRLDFCVEVVESGVGDAGIANDGIWLNLEIGC